MLKQRSRKSKSRRNPNNPNKHQIIRIESNHHLFVSRCHSSPHVPGSAWRCRRSPDTSINGVRPSKRTCGVAWLEEGITCSEALILENDPFSGCYKRTQRNQITHQGGLCHLDGLVFVQKIAIIELSINGGTLLYLNHMSCDLKHPSRCLSMFQSHSAFTTSVFFVL